MTGGQKLSSSAQARLDSSLLVSKPKPREQFEHRAGSHYGVNRKVSSRA